MPPVEILLNRAGRFLTNARKVRQRAYDIRMLQKNIRMRTANPVMEMPRKTPVFTLCQRYRLSPAVVEHVVGKAKPPKQRLTGCDAASNAP